MNSGAYCIGTYPKWVARVIRWAIVRNGSTTVRVEFKGRGGAIDGATRRNYPYGLPVSKASKVAIYLRSKRTKAGVN